MAMVQATVDDVTEIVDSSRVEIDGHEAMRIGAAKQVSRT